MVVVVIGARVVLVVEEVEEEEEEEEEEANETGPTPSVFGVSGLPDLFSA